MLVDLYRRYHRRGLEIVGLAYEVTGDTAVDAPLVRRFRATHAIPYPLLLAGVSDAAAAGATLPQLRGFTAFPTSIFLGRDGRVRLVHAGFLGAATGPQHGPAGIRVPRHHRAAAGRAGPVRRAGLALALAAGAGVAGPLGAQAPVQVGEGWTITFAGNVNVFYRLHQRARRRAGPDRRRTRAGGAHHPHPHRPPALDRGGGREDARGHGGPGAHFRIGVQISNASVHDNLDDGTQAGARIDMRQAYLTIGGGWGQVLAGRELSLYQRENILNDMTLFGTGASGGGLGAPGTTLGRSGFGYIYPNFNAQITYSSPASRPWQLSVGLFDPDRINGDFSSEGAAPTAMPRVEAEATWHGTGAGTRVRLWLNGMHQGADQGVTARGLAREPGWSTACLASWRRDMWRRGSDRPTRSPPTWASMRPVRSGPRSATSRS